ncbi:unnamed protein product [Toxocara canis]|uniref:Flocculation protein FLO11-like n=1 Tax=Toxocara canis TaxID=6265 RepID=A0A183UBK5_TOXCA|nr:unnamed protein product [Toxocara canis]
MFANVPVCWEVSAREQPKIFGSSAKESKAESKAFIINDRQTAAVSATVSLVRSNKLCPQKLEFVAFQNAKCSQATSSAVATFATPSQPVTVQKPMFANFASTLTSRPVLIVHPAKTSFSQTAIRSYKTFSFGEPSLTLDNSSAVASDYIESDLTNKTAEKPELQLESSTPNSAVSRVSHSSGDSKESSSNRLSKGFLDFTQGSSDRLQRWKSKLQTGRRHKDTSEPPPLIRNTNAVATVNRDEGRGAGEVRLSEVAVIIYFDIDLAALVHNFKCGHGRIVYKAAQQFIRGAVCDGLDDKVTKQKASFGGSGNMPAVQEPSGHSSDAEIVLDWTHSKFVPLHPSVSERFDASNKSTFVTQIMRPRVLHPAVSATDILRTTDADKEFVSLRFQFCFP